MALVPTPFQHLVYARQVLDSAQLPDRLRERLQGSLGAFLLGNTAGDVQSLTGGSRYSTHFYHISSVGHPPAYEVFFAEARGLADPDRLSPAHAAFISGYLVHLAYDQVWARDVFLPFYRNASHWNDRLSYSIHHNAVRVWLDRRAQVQLAAWPEVAALLRGVHPQHWLPFVEDAELERWAEWVTSQIEHSTAQTSQVFAERMGVSVERLDELASCIEEGRCVLPKGLAQALIDYEDTGLTQSVSELCHYWGLRAPGAGCEPLERQRVSISP